jgi:hypothetical protein
MSGGWHSSLIPPEEMHRLSSVKLDPHSGAGAEDVPRMSIKEMVLPRPGPNILALCEETVILNEIMNWICNRVTAKIICLADMKKELTRLDSKARRFPGFGKFSIVGYKCGDYIAYVLPTDINGWFCKSELTIVPSLLFLTAM